MFNSTMRDLSLDPVSVKFAISQRLDTSKSSMLARAFAFLLTLPISSSARWSARARPGSQDD